MWKKAADRCLCVEFLVVVVLVGFVVFGLYARMMRRQRRLIYEVDL